MISTLLPPPVSTTAPATGAGPRRRRRRRWLVLLLVPVLLASAVAAWYLRVTVDERRDWLGADGWPVQGQAALAIQGRPVMVGPHQHPAPIASLAKVMTAHLVLRARPLDPGFSLTVTAADAERTDAMRDQDQSVVAVRPGEVLTERQALVALLLPSANNVAVMLARRVAGSTAVFVRWMNAEARRLGMRATHYADPSGYDPRTVSTAADQVRLAQAVASDRTLTAVAAMPSAQLPVAGVVHNTDTLLGHDGFVGTKTGSHDAAGGCLMFRARRTVDGRTVDVLGVVLGQRGRSLIDAGLYSARQLVRTWTPGVTR